MESREDFLQRYRMKSTNSTTSTTTSSRWIRPQTTTAVSSTAVKVFDEKTDFNSGSQPPTIIDVAPSEEAASLLPLLTSNCPGWICFAEKTHPQAIPFISTVKSPQQILGLLIKSMLSQRPSGGLSLGDLDSPAPQSEVVVVVSVQPCYDKKLEASRLVTP